MRKVDPPFGGTEEAVDALRQAFDADVSAAQLHSWWRQRHQNGFPAMAYVQGRLSPQFDLAKYATGTGGAPMAAPNYAAIAGDWHGNTRWAVMQIDAMCVLLKQAGEAKPLILHAGDFGIWPGKPGQIYLDQVSGALERNGARLWFVDGNHDDHDQLDAIRREFEGKHDLLPPWPVAYRVEWLPRGYRWEWHGRTWLALGGAVSVDRAIRTPGTEWWPQEAITLKQAADVSAAGHADVMLCHDAPAGVPLTYTTPPAWWDKADLASSEEHRKRLAGVVSEVRPSYLIHGHHHQGRPRWDVLQFPHGELSVAPLNCDGEYGNWGVLSLKDMRWVG